MTAFLPMPYRSQWDEDANARRTDCGTSCVAMLIQAELDQRIPINTLSMQTSLSYSDDGLPCSALVKLLQWYGIAASLGNVTSAADIEARLDQHKPVICLIRYGAIPERMDVKDVNGNHFVIALGYDADSFYLHDPDFWAPIRAKGQYLKVKKLELLAGIASSYIPGQCVFVEAAMIVDGIQGFTTLVGQLLAVDPTAELHVTTTSAKIVPNNFTFDFTAKDHGDTFQEKSAAPPLPTVTSKLNLRTGPSTSNAIIRVLPAGASFTVDASVPPKMANGVTWIRVTVADGTSGYLARDFTSLA